MTKMATGKQVAILIAYGVPEDEARGYTRALAATKISKFLDGPVDGATPRRDEQLSLPTVANDPSICRQKVSYPPRPPHLASHKQINFLVFLGVPRNVAQKMSKAAASDKITELQATRNKKVKRNRFEFLE